MNEENQGLSAEEIERRAKFKPDTNTTSINLGDTQFNFSGKRKITQNPGGEVSINRVVPPTGIGKEDNTGDSSPSVPDTESDTVGETPPNASDDREDIKPDEDGVIRIKGAEFKTEGKVTVGKRVRSPQGDSLKRQDPVENDNTPIAAEESIADAEAEYSFKSNAVTNSFQDVKKAEIAKRTSDEGIISVQDKEAVDRILKQVADAFKYLENIENPDDKSYRALFTQLHVLADNDVVWKGTKKDGFEVVRDAKTVLAQAESVYQQIIADSSNFVSTRFTSGNALTSTFGINVRLAYIIDKKLEQLGSNNRLTLVNATPKFNKRYESFRDSKPKDKESKDIK